MQHRSGLFLCLAFSVGWAVLMAQEKSVKPGINDSFKNPDLEKYAKTFEGESREVFVLREKILRACGIQPGEIVADVGAGTGLFTRLFARATGPTGQVLAVDIAPKFLEHIQATCRTARLDHVTPILCREDHSCLPPASVDLVFICDTYHHFEYPQKTMASIHRALRPGGRLILVDFERIPGRSSDWTLQHVRAGRETVLEELKTAGFGSPERLLAEDLVENYMVRLTRIPATNR